MSDAFGGLIVVILWIVGAAGWITHIVWCIGAASYTGSAIALLIVGVVLFPVGLLHGWSLWLGFTWI